MKTLYIHIPFCEKKCFYCSFVVSVGQVHRIDQYLNCLEKEAAHYAREEVKNIYIGGGTPTLMSNHQLARLFDIIYKHFDIPTAGERTIESNPEGLDRTKLELLRDCGITRISLGVQSLNDRYLKLLGRNHDSFGAIETFRQMREGGFDNINLDLMFGFSGQTIKEIKEDVNAIVQLGSEHLSLYALTIEERSRFFSRNVQLADGSSQAEQYSVVCDLLKVSGFEQYEVSNFSKDSKVSQHNLNCWQGGEYIGLGVGAHSYIGAKRSWNVTRLNEYISRIEKSSSAEEGFESLTAFDQMRESVLFGLRMNQGINAEEIQRRFNCSLTEEQLMKIDDFIREGFLVKEKGRLRVSNKGRLVLDELCVQLL